MVKVRDKGTRHMHDIEDEELLVGKIIEKVTWYDNHGLAGIIFTDGSHMVLAINYEGVIDFIYDKDVS